MKHAMGVPEIVTLPNRAKLDGLEALCITLQRYAYPCRYGDLVRGFGRPVPQLCLAFNWMTSFIWDNHKDRISSLDQQWLSPHHLETYADAVHQKGAALRNCWGFVDGTVRPVCRPGEHQQVLYNGHKRIHALKYQSLTVPSGMIAHLYGPVEGRRPTSSGNQDYWQRWRLGPMIQEGTLSASMVIPHIHYAPNCRCHSQQRT